MREGLKEEHRDARLAVSRDDLVDPLRRRRLDDAKADRAAEIAPAGGGPVEHECAGDLACVDARRGGELRGSGRVEVPPGLRLRRLDLSGGVQMNRVGVQLPLQTYQGSGRGA